MDPIEEIDSKKKRNVMLENMQRSSSMFQARVQKKETEAAEKAKAQAQEAPPEAQDQMDFSSEFSNQDASLNGQGQSAVLQGWEDLIDDDDWLKDESEDNEDGGGGGSGGREQSQESRDESEPEKKDTITPPSGWRQSSVSSSNFFPQAPPETKPATPTTPGGTPKVEERLGFSWGPVQPRQEGQANGGSTPPPPVEPAQEFQPTVGPLPTSASRKGGWQAVQSQPVLPRLRPIGGEMLAPRGQVRQLDSNIVSAARLLIQTPEDEPGYDECLRLLSRFGLGAIRLCNRSKVQVHILDERRILEHPEIKELGLHEDRVPVDGCYLVETRTCLIDRRCLTEKPRYFHPALYYFAHALDHAQGGEDFSSRKAAAVVACFEASCEGYNGCDFVDELAAADPVRYFARSVSIYLGRDDCCDPLWTHQDLHDFDRSMYDYLEYLFARFSG